jgi:hypothetical protein
MTFWLQVISPLVMVLGGIIGWLVRSHTEEQRSTREKLNEKRRKAYLEILGPYIRIFADLKGKGPTQALNEVKSYDYRKTAFELALFGSDDVVRAYNIFMQQTYKAEAVENKELRARELMRLWGKLLLEIRKDVGNKKTKLDEFDMLRGMINDIDKLN